MQGGQSFSVRPVAFCMIFWRLQERKGTKKNGPRMNGGQVALVLSLCESLMAAFGLGAVSAEKTSGRG